MEYKAFLLTIRAPFFSIKLAESFQVAKALLIPQPSSLIGALAYAYAIIKEVGVKKALKEISKNIIIARAIIDNVALINPVVLRRLRILDKGMEKPKDKKKSSLPPLIDIEVMINQGKISKASEKVIRELFDAMYREYVHTYQIKALFIVKRELKVKLEHLVRLGDSESLVSVTDVKETTVKTVQAKNVLTSYPLPAEKVIDIEGDFVLLKMCDEKHIDWRTGKCKSIDFVVPLKSELVMTNKGKKVRVYKQSMVHVSFSRPQEVYVVDENKIVP